MDDLKEQLAKIESLRELMQSDSICTGAIP